MSDAARTIIQANASDPIYGDILNGRISYSYDHVDGTYTDPVSHQDSNGHNRNDVLASLLFTPDSHINVDAVAYFGEDQFNNPTVVSYKQNCAIGTANSYCGNLNDNQLGPFPPASSGADSTGLDRRTEHVHVDRKFDYDFGTFDVPVGFNHIATKSVNEFTGTQTACRTTSTCRARTTPSPIRRPTGRFSPTASSVTKRRKRIRAPSFATIRRRVIR